MLARTRHESSRRRRRRNSCSARVAISGIVWIPSLQTDIRHEAVDDGRRRRGVIEWTIARVSESLDWLPCRLGHRAAKLLWDTNTGALVTRKLKVYIVPAHTTSGSGCGVTSLRLRGTSNLPCRNTPTHRKSKYKLQPNPKGPPTCKENPHRTTSEAHEPVDCYTNAHSRM